MWRKEILVSIFFIILSIIVFVLTFRFPKQTVALSPTAFPRFISVSLFFLSIILLVSGLIAGRKNSQQKEVNKKYYQEFTIKLLIMILLAFIYTRILPIVGYVLATPLLIAGNMLLFKEKRWLWVITVSLVTTFLLYALFRMVFKIPLPRFNIF
jgi:putative tricarboxylic transport membrane protein